MVPDSLVDAWTNANCDHAKVIPKIPLITRMNNKVNFCILYKNLIKNYIRIIVGISKTSSPYRV
jgi:hypothetical protein